MGALLAALLALHISLVILLYLAFNQHGNPAKTRKAWEE